MKHFCIFFAQVIFLSGLMMAGGQDLTVSWDRGLKLTSEDKSFELKIGGRLQNDWTFFSADQSVEEISGNLEDGSEFRRAYLTIAGTMYGNIEFKAEYDFAGGDADFKDVYLGLKKVFGHAGLRIGHFKEPFSLEEQTSDNYITFLERAMPIEAFVPSRNVGFMLHQADNRFTYGVGIFKDADDYGTPADNVSESTWAVTGRVAGTLYDKDEGKSLLHLGLAYTSREPAGDSVRIRTRPEIHLMPSRLVDTHAMNADGFDVLGTEIALVQGPFSMQGEYMLASVDLMDGDSVDFTGYYVFVSYFLTGESRPYRKGSFDRVSPAQNFTPGGGSGAWEVALRYSSMDLNDGPVSGGKEDNLTLALNWYLNPNTRLMLNYVNADVTDVGTVDAFMMRFHVDF
ncbi:MAG TPA: porin [Thermoanaerobaculia bacterium]|nr:porin [Thermoanaerobaculia bacterium]HUM30668.1 porin [Thermoanaerobaculia bacterium]HXK68924.1 porin [Thermoanaerobaculia bacterium]